MPSRRTEIDFIDISTDGQRLLQFESSFGKSDEDLASLAARRYTVDTTPGCPHRFEMRDLAVGENALFVNYTHLADAGSPYRSSHAVFVREGATVA
jgi:hypothetical protein